jgi:acyl-coenzyme A synthetase/AMP-(fatty) acid ligase
MKALPKTNTGKIRKVELRTQEEYGRTFDREIDRWVNPKSALS